MSTRVALLVVSHSRHLAQGVRELASQMAPDVYVGAAGGLPDGSLGTSFELVQRELARAREAADDGVVVVTDLGSAAMTVESAQEFLGDPADVKLVDGPLVEGAVAAAAAAGQGAGLAEVAEAVVVAQHTWCAHVDQERPEVASEVTGEAVVADSAGIHARPAAELARVASSFDADIQLNGVDAKSVLQVMTLGIPCGEKVTVTATGAQAEDAVARLVEVINEGFDK